MEGRFINRYKSFCNSLRSLSEAKNRDLSDSFVLSGTVQKYSLTFDISWKVMKDIIVKYHKKTDFALGSPREVLRAAYGVGLINDDIWMEMLSDRNELAHDYDGTLAEECCDKIVGHYIDIFEGFAERARYYMEELKKEFCITQDDTGR